MGMPNLKIKGVLYMSVKLFKGEFISYNWNEGLYEEKNRVAEKHGYGAYVCSVNNFSYQGEVKSNLLDKHITNRCSELQYNAPIGEVVKVGSPVKYIKLTAGVQETRLPSTVNVDLLAKAVVGKAMNVSIKGRSVYMPIENRIEKKRYGVVGIQGDSVNYLLFTNSLTEISRFIFPYLTNQKSNIKYYVVDYMSSKDYECCIKQETVERTTLQSTNYQTIIPLYRFVYYGCVKLDNI